MKSEMELLKTIVDNVFGMDISKTNRRRETVDARMIYAMLLRGRNHTFASIGRSLKQDHTTIIHHCGKADDILAQDDSLMRKYIACRDMFQEALSLDSKDNFLEQAKLNTLMLRSQVERLILENEKLSNELKIKTEDKKFSKIFDKIRANTPDGVEDFVYKKIDNMFKELQS
jgi:transcriptional antiterminator Rof (Rho-off)